MERKRVVVKKSYFFVLTGTFIKGLGVGLRMILSFAVEKAKVEKREIDAKKIETRNSLKIVNVEEKSLEPLNKEKVLKFKFTYSVAYEPNAGSFELEGNVLVKMADEQRKLLLELWNTKKKLDPPVARAVFNYLLTKCSILSLSWTQELNLPPHIPFPRISSSGKRIKHNSST